MTKTRKHRESPRHKQAAARPQHFTYLDADPPRPHRWLLLLSTGLLAGWMVFLAVLAIRAS